MFFLKNMFKNKYLKINLFLTSIVLLALFLGFKTYLDLSLTELSSKFAYNVNRSLPVVDRNGIPLDIVYCNNNWNSSNYLPLYKIPLFLRQAFILSEDKLFYSHYGVNWQARLAAALQNTKALFSISNKNNKIRGASTISEQLVRIMQPRPRNLWSKWLETITVYWLENKLSKEQIFELYLNQLPYAANRRGVQQASYYYFNRDLSTLSYKEMLALVVLVRAPSSFDLYKPDVNIDKSIMRLANLLHYNEILNNEDLLILANSKIKLKSSKLTIDASHFVRFIRNNLSIGNYNNDQNDKIYSTLDSELQNKVQKIIDQRLKNLSHRKVKNGAVLVVNHNTSEIIVWVVGGGSKIANDQNYSYYLAPSNFIDAVTTLRQPGSSLKPFLYALAFTKGWSPAMIIDDSPLSERIGSGLHKFFNYSRRFYGAVTAREALGNSLNIPALQAIKFVGNENYLSTLHNLGFTNLNQSSDFYRDGLALGNGEVTLFELVQAYSALARMGEWRPLRFLLTHRNNTSINYSEHYYKIDDYRRIFQPNVASLIANILSDPDARKLEFGNYSILNFQQQTAVKTGTSTDYHDAWAVGYDDKYVVGVWLGNLDRKPTDGVTGASGPALVMRSVFAEINKFDDQRNGKLFLSPDLIKEQICIPVHLLGNGKLLENNNPYSNNERVNSCSLRTEYFLNKQQIKQFYSLIQEKDTKPKTKLLSLVNGLKLAIDPRIPQSMQYYKFSINDSIKDKNYEVEWVMDGKSLAKGLFNSYDWSLEKGEHELEAIVRKIGEGEVYYDKASFSVK